ncbi:MAG: cytochrome c [Gallionella sp.]
MKTNRIKLASWLFAPLLLAGAASCYAGDINKGAQLYRQHCVTCHGVDGINLMPDAPNFAHSEKLLRPDNFILDAVKQGANAMPSYAGVLKDQDILDIISYLRTMENGGPMRP